MVCLSYDRCDFQMKLLENSTFSKPLCEWDSGFIIPDFSLDRWLQENSIMDVTNLLPNMIDKLMKEIGLKRYLKSKQCNRLEAPYTPSEDQWQSDCHKEIQLPTLPQAMSCYIPDMCTGFKCCVDISIIQRSFEITLTLDTCHYQLDIEIERLHLNVPLVDYKYGEETRVYLFGVVRLRFTIIKINESSFRIDAAIDICFEQNEACIFSSPILEDAIIPILFCSHGTGFRIPGFSFDGWLKSNGLKSEYNITDSLLSGLLQEYGITNYLQTEQCNVRDDKFQIRNRSCNTNPDIQVSSDISCSVTDTCLGLSCCIQSAILERSFEIKFEIDVCRYAIHFQIESYTSTLLLNTSEFDVWKTFELQGLLKIRYRIFDLFEKDSFILDVSIKLCLSDNEYCILDMPIFQRQSFLKPFCNKNLGFITPDFSLSEWLDDKGFSSNITVLSDDIVENLLNDLGISKYLLHDSCAVTSPRWINKCNSRHSNVDLPPGVSCGLDKECKELSCCLEFQRLQKTFSIVIRPDACKMKLTARIEEMTVTKSLFNFTYDDEQIMDLLGFLKIRYRIIDLQGAGVFSIRLGYSLYVESSNCSKEIVLFENLHIAKPNCIHDTSLQYKSLADFFKYVEVAPEDALPADLIPVFLHMTELKNFLADEACEIKTSHNVVFGNSDECPVFHLPSDFENNVSCSFDHNCSSVNCCLTAPLIWRNLFVGVKLDTCERRVHIYVEKLKYELELSEETFGIQHSFSLSGMLKLRIKVDYITVDNIFIVDMGVKLCWDANTCSLDVSVLNNSEISIPMCDWNKGYSVEGFSLSSWKTDHGLELNSNISGLVSDQLFEHLKLSQYLSRTCGPNDADYSLKASECSVDLPNWFSDNDKLVCGFHDSCSNITCCLKASSLGRSFTVNVDFRPCEFQMHISIERFKKRVSLSDYKWGMDERVSLFGLVTVTYSVFDVSAENAFVISLQLALCPEEDNSCLFNETVLDNQIIKRVPCNWNHYAVDSGFNLTHWMEFKDQHLGSFTKHGTQFLMEKLGIGELLLRQSCDLTNKIYDVDDTETVCPVANQFLPLFPTAVCRLSSECLELECCLDDFQINKRFKVQFKFDPCNYKYRIDIEKFTYENNLFDVDLETEQTVSLLGIVSVRYRIEHLDVDKMYRIAIGVRICYDKTTCPIDIMVLNNTLVPKPDCYRLIKQGFKVEDFSLKSWLNTFDTDVAVLPLPKPVSLILLSQLGITEYLEGNTCIFGQSPFNKIGWNIGECSLNVSVPDQELQDISCAFTLECTSLTCCITVPLIDRNIKVDIEVDPCTLEMKLGIERHHYFISLIDYDFGRQEKIWLAGVFRITFTINDITSKNEYLVSLKFEECWESNATCAKEYNILANQRLPKQICNFTEGYFISDFSLSSWMQEQGLSENSTIDITLRNNLLAVLGLANYLNKDECLVKTETKYQGPTGWINECPKQVELLMLNNGAHCQLADICTSVSCCVDLEAIDYSLQMNLDIDPCTQMLVIQIERLRKSIPLVDYTYGNTEELWLFGIARARFRLYDLHEERKYQLNFNISICLESKMPCQNFTVFYNTKLPKVMCEWGTRMQTAFSISSWMKNFGKDYHNISSLPAYALDVLYNDMGVAEFLSESQCVAGVQPYSIKSGIENECTEFTVPVKDLGPVACHLPSRCTAIECCIYTDILPRTVHVYLDIKPCQETLTVGIEKFTFQMDLINYDFGTAEHFWLQGIFRTDFRIFDLKEDEMYVVDLDVSVCLESEKDCTFQQNILSKALLPKPLCSLQEGFKISDFSFTGWLEEHAYSLGDRITDLDHSTLMSDLGLPRFLKESECKLSNFTESQTDNNTLACSLRGHLVVLQHPLACFLQTCNDIKCCLSVEPLDRNFMIGFSVDPCQQLLFLEIELFKSILSLQDFEWGKMHDVYLKGVIRVMFMLENLEGENAFILSLDVKACLEAEGPCLFEKNVFNKTKFSKQMCDYSTMVSFPIEDFSLLEWKLAHNLPTDGTIENPFSAILFENLGLSSYLNEIQCQVNHTDNNNGWINDCLYIPTMPLPESVSCTLDMSCSRLDCCVSIKSVNRNLSFGYDIDVCKSSVEVSIEKLQLKRSFFDFTWGGVKRLNFGGIVRFDFSFTDLQNERKIMSTAAISVCFETTATCVLQCNILDKVLFPKKACAWDNTFVVADFSLQRWVSQAGLKHGMPLDDYHASKLLELLNLSPYMISQSCNGNETSNTSWAFECKRSLSTGLLNLPSNMHCIVGESCTDIECCIGVKTLNKTFQTKIDIDPCAHHISVSIEKYKHTKQLFNYTWGQTEHFWLYGVVRMSYSIYDLAGEGKYIVNLNTSVCLEANEICQNNVQILQNALLPKLKCDWDVTFIDQDFDLVTWYLENGIQSGGSLSQKYIHILYNDLNLSSYMGEECAYKNGTFKISSTGWINECPHEVDTQQLSKSTVCRIPKYCTGVECCTEVSLIQRNINSFVFVHTCLNRLEIGIEKMKYTVDLQNFDFGTEKIVSLQGVFRLRFIIEDLKNEGVLLMTLDLSMCFSAKTECMENISILKNTKLKKPVCDMSTGYKMPDFSMKNWLSHKGLVAGNVDLLTLSLLNEQLGISTYLETDICEITKYGFGWKQDCPLNVDLPELPDNIFCSLSSSCNAVKCCLGSTLLQRNFSASLEINHCNMMLTIAIEKLQFEFSLIDYEWGEEKQFDLFGVTRVRYTIENLEMARMYLVNAQMAICLEYNDMCETVVTVFNNTFLPKLQCDLDQTFVIQNFSLSSWLVSKGYEYNNYLGYDITSELLEILGIVGYLNEECDRKSAVYKPSAYGWKRSCSLGINLLPLPNIQTCDLRPSCSSVDCCVDVHLLGKSFNFKFDIVPCSNRMEVAIEKLKFEIPLDSYKQGSLSRFCLLGVICLEYSVKDLPWSGIYIVDLRLSICFESSRPCQIESQIFNSTILPKQICSWEDANSFSNFTLTSWLTKRGIPQMTSLPSYLITVLENDIGLAMYLNEEECDRNHIPYMANISVCSSDCPIQIHTEYIHNDVSCYIPDYCTAVDMCVYVPLIKRSIHAYLHIKACDSVVEVGIEKFKFSVGLFDYEFGKDKEVSLKDVLKLRFRIYDLIVKGVFVVDLSICICFTNSSCEETFTIFKQKEFPKLPCSWDAEFKNDSFSLTEWMLEQNIDTSGFTEVYRRELFETLGLAAYLNENICYQNEKPFFPAENGWNTDCPAPLDLPSLPSSIGCYISDMCTSIQCCLELDIIQTAVQLQVTVDGCEKQLTVAIEKLSTVKDLHDYNFGSLDRFYLYGVYRIDFMIENFQGGRKYVMDLNISACFESSKDCEYIVPVLKKTILPKVKCQWENGFASNNFSFEGWKNENGVSENAPLSSTQFSVLSNDLQISQYLQESSCNGLSGTQNWSNDCSLAVSLPPLPDNTKCTLGPSCLSVDCCIYVQPLNHSFQFSLHIDDCNFQVSASIEKLVMERKLSSFEFGKRIVFDIDGLISLKFLVVNLKNKNKYMLDLDVDISLEAQEPPQMSVTIFDDMLAPRIPCWRDSEFIDKDFSLEKWKEDNVIGTLDQYMSLQLLEDLGIAAYMHVNRCFVHNETKIDTDLCPMDVEVYHFYDGGASCSLTELCTGISCCVESSNIPVTFFIEAQIDACNKELTVQIEKMRFDVPFENITWGEVQTFRLYGVIKIEIEVLERITSQVYTLNLNVSICLQGNETCGTEYQLLKKADLTAMPCSWSSEFLEMEFDFDEWRNESAYAIPEKIPESGVAYYFSKIGVASYLQSVMCDILSPPYLNPSASGWTSDCSFNASVQTLPLHTRCFMEDTCTGFKCCSYSNILQRSFQIQFKLDSCKQILTIGIERVLHHISLTEFEWDVGHKFYLNGLIKIDYLVSNLPIREMYLTSANLSICMDHNTCEIKFEILKNDFLPKALCQLNPGYTDEEFSLTEWMSDKGVNEIKGLDPVQRKQLTYHLGISPYLSEQECQIVNSTSECEIESDFPQSCSISNNCGRISCCLYSDVLQRHLFYELDYDRCNHIVKMTIETFSRTISLYDFEYGKLMVVSLYSALRIEFTIDYLVLSRAHILSLNISECFESAGPCSVVEVLKGDKFSSEDCLINKDYKDNEFSLKDWSAQMNLDSSNLPAYARGLLFRDLGISQYLQFSECLVQQYNNSQGWSSECKEDITLLNITDSNTTISCSLQSSCSDLTCCLFVNEIQHAFDFKFLLDPCELKLTVGIEKLVYNIPLKEATSGRYLTMSLNGFLRMEFTIDEVLNKEYAINLRLKVCPESILECSHDIEIFRNFVIEKRVCDFGSAYAIPDFSLENWKAGNGLASDHLMTDQEKDLLMQQLGLEHFLQQKPCTSRTTPGRGNHEFFSPGENVTCVRTTVGDSFDCCVESRELGRTLWMNFTLNACSYSMEFNLENVKQSYRLLNYEWDMMHYVTTKGVWRAEYMLTNIQSEKKFSLFILLQLCFKQDCKSHIPVAKNITIPYPTCHNMTTNDTQQPFYGISYDFWKQPLCSVDNTTLTNLTGCNTLPLELQNICTWKDSCSGIQCCTRFYFVEDRRNILIDLEITCDGKLQYAIENKRWNATLMDSIGPIHEVIADSIMFEMNVSHTASLSYEVSIIVSVCTSVQNLYDCQLNFRLKETVTKPTCNKRRRRSVIPLVAPDMDIKYAVQQLMSQGIPLTDIQNFITEAIEFQNGLKTQVWQVEKLSDSDSSTGYASTMKALGQNNPQTLKHRRSMLSEKLDVEGADKIFEMIGSASDIANRADQLFLVGSGLTKVGTQLLSAQLANMTIGDLESMLEVNKMDPAIIGNLMDNFFDLAKALYSEVVDKLFSGQLGNPFESFELSLKGKFVIPRRSVQLFNYVQNIPLGGYLMLTFTFGANGYFGLELGWEGKLIAQTAGANVTPYAGLTCYGEVGIGNVLYGKLRLEGNILDLRFPTRAEIGFSKFPLDVGLMMDLELTPVTLRLIALVTLEINLILETKRKVLFSKDLWHYTAPTIRKRLIDVSTKEPDESPPQFLPLISNENSNRRRRGVPSCDISQIRNRDYSEPAFEISVEAADDRSNVKFFLDVGTFPASNNVENNLQLGGPSTVLATSVDEYPTGEPLYFTMYAENSAGTRAVLSCMLSTYDTTLPTARITPGFLTTSNPNVIKASVLVHDDSEITTAYSSIGYGPGIYGDQIIPWILQDLQKKSPEFSESDPLNQFTDLQDGKLVSTPISTQTHVYTATACAQSCLNLDHCISFNYDYGPSGTCELLRALRHYDETLSNSGLFCHFERLSSGHSLEINHKALNMQHNRLYFVNIDLQNVLGYRSLIPSAGILTDYTCPEPGPIENATQDILRTDGCVSLIPPDRPDLRRYCVGVYPKRLNHRVIIDGIGSRTVFNGDQPLLDLKYTRSDNFIAGNWDGITDDETGIRAYALAAGHHICEDSIHPHHDPHKHLMHETQWTHMGVITATKDFNPFPLKSGKYYMTVRAINKVEYGGPLATTICHTTPYIIDITNPVIYEIFDIKYNEDNYVLSAEQNSTDTESGVDIIELCIGNNPRNCDILSWTRRTLSPFINYTHHITDGIPAWIRLRVTNNVELHSVGRADQAIIVDSSPPLAGTVYDGPLFGEDLQYTKYSNQICLNWKDFFDPESGISSYAAGVGTGFGLTDIAELQPLTLQMHYHCVTLDKNTTLIHNNVYYTVVWAYNGAVNQKNISANSNGVHVDLTKPKAGIAVDGYLNNLRDIKYSSSKSSVQVQWANFSDPESDIRQYDVKVEKRRHDNEWLTVKQWSKFDNFSRTAEWRNFHLEHNDEIRSIVKAMNGALNDIETQTDGFIIDLTSPQLEYLNDGDIAGRDIEYQVDVATVKVAFKFYDPESGISKLKFQIHEQQHGKTSQIYPDIALFQYETYLETKHFTLDYMLEIEICTRTIVFQMSDTTYDNS